MKISYILFILFIIIDCTPNNIDEKNTITKITNRSKKSLSEENTEVQKTTEELLIEKLNDKQKEALSFLKESLESQKNFNKFLNSDEDKIKSALDHINSEYSKCTEDNANEQKTIFKTTLKSSFESNSDNLDQFKNQASSVCGVHSN
ncbi:Mlp family lipoprotein (plasmid) [Borreliella andersonii]|uniref:Mlp family lipoprotein n=1 Tax=Borrelia andersonii TaxID=42109 RepID=A0ACD5G653_BORAD